MGLVDYSDSEGSGSEAPLQSTKPAPVSSANPPTSSKLGFEKVVDSSNKIKVSLPSANAETASAANQPEEDAGERPAKRAKTGGAFSGFGSLLPAPKNPNASKPATTGGSILAQSKGGRVGGRINLKTSAQPAFVRAPQEVDDEMADQDSAPITKTARPSEPGQDLPRASASENASTETEGVKAAPKPMMFKPLSVTRKTTKKKPPGSSTSGPQSGESRSSKATPHPSANATSAQPPAKPKVSLFSSGPKEQTKDEPQKQSEYQPIMNDEEEQEGDDTYNAHARDEAQTQQAPPQTQAAPTTDLHAMADNLGLSASERRQLFGRGGGPSNAQIAQFNLAEEYKRNEELRQKEDATPGHNPVKSIAPGKHSLQQLVSAAQNNKDALDESFARGRSNKKAGASKYGW